MLSYAQTYNTKGTIVKTISYKKKKCKYSQSIIYRKKNSTASSGQVSNALTYAQSVKAIQFQVLKIAYKIYIYI